MKALHGIIIGAVAARAVPALATGGKKMAIEEETESSSSSSTSNSSPKQPAAVSGTSNSIIKNSVVATGPDLINEMKALHTSLGHLQTLLESASVKDDTELLRRSAKFFRRARWLIYASNHENVAQSTMQRRMERRGVGSDSGSKIRGGIGNGIMVARSEDQERRLIQDMPELKDDVARNLYEATITFPECEDHFLADCLEILNQELYQLQLDAEIVVHEKRNIDQSGYNKVVIVTDLSATSVQGGDNDGKVLYPFLWDDAISGPHMIGVDGKFDCLNVSPQDCCNIIKTSTPNPDTKGNYIDCHFFVPYGGVGNPKRSDRVLVNLSPDGRVHEAPIVS